MNEEQPLDNPKFTDLTPEQDQAIVDLWNKTPHNPPSLVDICKHIFGQVYDGRSLQMRAIKKSLSKRNLKTNRGTEYVPQEFVLAEEHKLFITNHAGTMNAWEIAKEMLNNPVIERASKEVRAINDFIKTLDTRVVLNGGKDAEDVPEEDYKPPKRPEAALARVNMYVNLDLDIKNLKPTEKKGIEQLINYLSTYRFIKQMNAYEKESDRKSCEDAFIRYTWDKPDLSQEEVDQYIVLANEVVMASKAQRRMEKLQQILENVTELDAEHAKISMSLTEAIGKANTEFNECINRQSKLLANLTQKRSSKLEKQVRDNASILNLVELWKNEESRRELIALGKKEQEDLKEEVDRLMSLPELKCRILGMTVEEAIYG